MSFFKTVATAVLIIVASASAVFADNWNWNNVPSGEIQGYFHSMERINPTVGMAGRTAYYRAEVIENATGRHLVKYFTFCQRMNVSISNKVKCAYEVLDVGHGNVGVYNGSVDVTVTIGDTPTPRHDNVATTSSSTFLEAIGRPGDDYENGRPGAGWNGVYKTATLAGGQWTAERFGGGSDTFSECTLSKNMIWCR